LGISHALASHHLRQLAKYGFVEQAAGADQRERAWRLVYTSWSMDGIDERPGGSAAVEVLEQVIAERAVGDLIGWHKRRADWSAAWRESAALKQSTLYLTEQEHSGLTSAIDGLLLGYAEQRPLDDIASRPADSVPVDFTLIVVPNAPTADGH
jgi:hypothetical protein